MQVKARLFGNPIDINSILINTTNLQLTSTIYVEKLPLKKDVGVMTIIENFEETRNYFNLVIKNIEDKVLVTAPPFRGRISTKEKEAILIYNIIQIPFETTEDKFKIELWNENVLIDSFILGCCTEINDIYSNLLPKGKVYLKNK